MDSNLTVSLKMRDYLSFQVLLPAPFQPDYLFEKEGKN